MLMDYVEGICRKCGEIKEMFEADGNLLCFDCLPEKVKLRIRIEESREKIKSIVRKGK